MSLPDPLTHINTYGERRLDTGTLKHLLTGAHKALGINIAILSQYRENDHAGRSEWLALTKEEDDANAEAVKRIRAELTRRET